MDNSMFPVSTTNEIAGWRTIVHMDLVTAHVVAGTGFFSDLAAGISDILGGHSQSYQNQLSSICKEVIRQLCLQAAGSGANAIVGLRLDYSDISGKGMSMLMVSGTGTAVHAVLENDEAKNMLLEQNKSLPQPVVRLTQEQWRCRCGSINDRSSETCTNWRRSVNAIY